MSKISACDLAPRHPVNSQTTNKHLQEDKLRIQRTGLPLSNSAGTFQKENAFKHLNDNSEISPKLQRNSTKMLFKVTSCVSSSQTKTNRTRMVTVIILLVSLTKHWTITSIVNGSIQLPYSPLTTSASDSGCR
jgi:hypothetical protein